MEMRSQLRYWGCHGRGGSWMGLAQPPGLCRQREQTATKRLDSLGDRAGDRAGSQQSLVASARPWVFPPRICAGLCSHTCAEKRGRGLLLPKDAVREIFGVLSQCVD